MKNGINQSLSHKHIAKENQTYHLKIVFRVLKKNLINTANDLDQVVGITIWDALCLQRKLSILIS